MGGFIGFDRQWPGNIIKQLSGVFQWRPAYFRLKTQMQKCFMWIKQNWSNLWRIESLFMKDHIAQRTIQTERRMYVFRAFKIIIPTYVTLSISFWFDLVIWDWRQYLQTPAAAVPWTSLANIALQRIWLQKGKIKLGFSFKYLCMPAHAWPLTHIFLLSQF